MQGAGRTDCQEQNDYTYRGDHSGNDAEWLSSASAWHLQVPDRGDDEGAMGWRVLPARIPKQGVCDYLGAMEPHRGPGVGLKP